jgi:hypothetical protein
MAFKMEIMHKRCPGPIIDIRFSPWRKICAHKNNAFNKVIARHNQLMPDLELSPYKVGPGTSPILSPPLSMLVLRFTNHEASSSMPQRIEPPFLFLGKIVGEFPTAIHIYI